MTRVLVIGSGGREHAIAHALLRGGSVTDVYCAPGNPGMNADGIITVALSQSNHSALIDFARDKDIDWVFVGPEAPLIEGLVDDFQAAGIPAFGPSRVAAQIEGSKTFAKELMARHSVPTAAYATFSEYDPAVAYVREQGAPIVIKADGLAAGKGVTVAMDEDTAEAALADIFLDKRFGEAGSRVVIEEFLDGEEFSLMCFARGTEFWPMPISQDHKRAYDGDLGPNTGGMGAYSPVPQIPSSMVDEALDTIITPVLEGMAAEGTPFTGILYAGLIATASGPKVIEFNARFGDPETEVVLPKLTSDLGAGISALLSGGEPEFTWDTTRTTLGVVVASEGYPDTTQVGATVPELDYSASVAEHGTHVYYAGVAQAAESANASDSDSAGLVSSSGRVLLVQTTAASVPAAQEIIYSVLDAASADGLFYRHDIGAKAI
ncbi:phosphoribosylamine--glycine ligase [Alloscardovia macacae]|uniref:Phosphoribosylamine--glycine ligase n=1 Tax=Alloscardovia macacae TaxID=1160091 RepID=A0A1Y2T259_9BIFI|nr:phosphoribosylamine--glycine ligase [Alloscardovia macacae]OTA29384.1 phosphoribosylamine--glycine ligase [Alloscardovia macacae]